MYGNRPDRWSERLGRQDRLRFVVNCLTRMRVCDAQGRLDLGFKGGLDSVPRKLVPWFRAPARRSRRLRIVCGHWSALGYYEGDGIVALDTGCVWGGRLCAIRLDRPAPPSCVRSRQAEVHDD
jgi:bis(5'-nucleosyl)-tetraphosphatase (symmetrical)